MTTTPTTKWKKLTRRLGLDGNPLRRRSDVVASWLVPVAIVLFLAMCPVTYGLCSMWVHSQNAAAQRASRSWHKVTATLLQSVPGPQQTDNGVNTWVVQAPAQWRFDGRTYYGPVPVPAGSTAGQTVRLQVNDAGKEESPPLNAVQVSDRVFSDTLIGLAALAVFLTGLAWGLRSVMDRRRLASWEIEWLAVGPRWSRQG